MAMNWFYRTAGLRPVMIVMALLAFALGLGMFRFGGVTGQTVGLMLGMVAVALAAALIYLHNLVVLNTMRSAELSDSHLRPPSQPF